METILRIAYNRWVVTKQMVSVADACKKFIEENIIENEKNNEGWADFREEKLWTLDVNDVLDKNKDSIALLHKRYWTGMNKAFNFCHAKTMFLEC